MKDSINDEFLKYRRVIASLLSKIRPNATPQDIEDILQDTFLNTFNSSLTQEIRFPKAFMVKTAIRLANRQLNIAQRTKLDEGIEDFSDDSLYHGTNAGLSSATENLVLQREEFGFLCEAVNQLPGQCRRVFILKKIYGWSQREISRHLEISESTVEKHVAKGLLKTRQFYNTAKSSTNATGEVNTNLSSQSAANRTQHKTSK